MSQMTEPRRRRKEKPKIEFEAGAVFEPRAAVDVELDLDSARYGARHGQAGDRGEHESRVNARHKE